MRYFFTNNKYRRLFKALHHDIPSHLETFTIILPYLADYQVLVIDVTYIKDDRHSMFEWFKRVCILISAAITGSPTFRLGIIWVNRQYAQKAIFDQCLTIIGSFLGAPWSASVCIYNAMNYGNDIDASRHVFTIIGNSQWHTTTQLVSSRLAFDFPSACSNCLSTDSDTSMIVTKLKLVESPHQDPLITKAHVLAIFHSATQTDFTTYSTNHYVLDSVFPSM